MNDKALATLEYNKITQLLAGKAVSQAGKNRCLSLLPDCDREHITASQRETAEAVSMIIKKGTLPLGGIRDVEESVNRAEIGGMLSIEELLDVQDFLYVARKTYAYFHDANEINNKNLELINQYVIIRKYYERIRVADALERELGRIIISPTQIADDASSALSEIRKSIRVSNERTREHLSSIIRSQDYKNMLQDSVITIRGDRFCIPVKQEYRNSFPGMVHDQSASGATFFIEPMSVVELNNKIKDLLAKEKKEIDRILRILTAQVAENSDLIREDYEILTALDFIFAKGELALSMKATEPIFNQNGLIHIKKGRHPLLDSDKVVPVDIWLGGEFTTLLITGPNTGGKTVALKTLGLFTLMGQAGLHIPAADRSELSVFDEVCADIGDEQSIEQSLSTFSSHMTNIVRILNTITDNSLVLLDELGAGTDPTEGAALAVSVIQYLLDRKIRTAVTTHYSELKVFALSTKGVENASCEFNVETLRPTYRLLIGIPGKSNAFAISRRLGLPEFLIDNAKEVLSVKDVRFEDMITELEINKKSAQIEKERAEQYRAEAESMKKEADIQRQKLTKQRERILDDAKSEARKIMVDAKETADGLIKTLRKQIEEGAAAIDLKVAEEVRKSLREGITAFDDRSGKQDKINSNRSAVKDIMVGQGVYINSLSQQGTVLALPDASNDVMVQAGIMKMKVKLNDLSEPEREEPKKAANRFSKPADGSSFGAERESVKAGKSQNITQQLDIRGHMVEEGIMKLDKYLDDAFLSGLGSVFIIHGKGTGVLRKGVQDHLKNHPHVKSFRNGVFGEGENGVTVIEMKS